MYKIIKKTNNHDFESKNCKDCYFLQGARSWFCVNEEVKKEEKYHTWISVYGYVSNCEHWQPCKTIKELSFLDKFNNDYIYE